MGVVDEVSRRPKDPSSLKFAENFLLVLKVVNPIDIKNNEDVHFSF